MSSRFVKRVIFPSFTCFTIVYIFYHEKLFGEPIAQFNKRINVLRTVLFGESVTRNKPWFHDNKMMKHYHTNAKNNQKTLKKSQYTGLKSRETLWITELTNKKVQKARTAKASTSETRSIHYEDDATKSFPLTLTRDYLINNKNICTSSKHISVLVMVHTATDHLARRQIIRSTYASRDLFLPAEVRVVFLLGRPAKLDQKVIDLESKTHGDIVQGDFLDSYHNLTHKAVMGLRWVTENCLNSKYVVKVDDDVVFDMWKFLDSFPDKGNGKTIWCNILRGAIINRYGKWAVSMREFRGRVTYPWPYCAGIVAVLNTGAIPPMYEAAFRTPFFWVDDIYVYGILRTNAKILTLKLMPRQCSVSNSMSYCHDSKPICPLMAVNMRNGNHTTTWMKMRARSKHLR